MKLQAFFYRATMLAASGFSTMLAASGFHPNLARTGDKCIGFCPGLLWKQELNLRSSHCSFPIKKGVLRNFVNFTEKHLYWSLFLIELQAKRLKHRCFPVEFTKFLKTYERLLLKPVVSPGVYFLISYTLAQIDTWFLHHNLQFLLPILPSLPILLILL